MGEWIRRLLRLDEPQPVRDAAIDFLDRREGQSGPNLGRRAADHQDNFDDGGDHIDLVAEERPDATDRGAG